MKKIRHVMISLMAGFFCCAAVFADDPAVNSNEAGSSQSADSKKTKKQEDKNKGKEKLGTIVITPTKTGQKLGNSPAAATVIDSEDIGLSGGKHLDETLKSVPGVYLKRSKIGDTTTSVAVRGFNGSGKNLIMWNGMPLNDSYSSSPNWSLNSMGSTDRVEVVRGPFSSLYGRNAMGGVVNILTKTPTKQEAEIKTGWGDNNTNTGYASYGDRYRDCFSIFVSYDYMSSDGTRNQLITVAQPTSTGTGTTAVTGWTPSTNTTGGKVYIIGDAGKNSFDQKAATGQLSWDITDNQKVDYAFKFAKYIYGYKDARSYLTDASGHSFTGTPGSSTSTVTINNNGTNYKATVTPKTFLAGSGENDSLINVMNYTLKNDTYTISAKLGSNTSSSKYSTPDTWSDFSGGAGKLSSTSPANTFYQDVQADIKILDLGVVTVGQSTRYDHAEGDQWNLASWKCLDSTSDATLDHTSEMEGTQLMSSLYSQVEYDVIKDMVMLYGGARYDYWQNYDGKSRYNTSTTATADTIKFKKTTDWNVAPKASIVIKPGFELLMVKLESVRASYGEAFNPPNIYQLYKDWTSSSVNYKPNPNLKPEKSRSWECGGDISFMDKTFILSGTYFGSRIKDMIYYQKLDATHKVYNNAGEGKVNGFELEAKLYLLEYFELYGNMTYTKTEVTKNNTDTASVGKQFNNVPKMMYNAGIKAIFSKAEGCLNWRYADHVYANSDNSDKVQGVYGSYDAIKLLDCKMSVKPAEKLKVSLSINNILNRKYYQYYKSDGRTFFTEAQMKF